MATPLRKVTYDNLKYSPYQCNECGCYFKSATAKRIHQSLEAHFDCLN